MQGTATLMQTYLTGQLDGSVGQPLSLNTQWLMWNELHTPAVKFT